MQPSKQMQQVITAITAKHASDLATVPVGSSLRLDMPNYDRLVIEKIGPKSVSVTHYFEQHGDLVADPEIVFFLDASGWIPLEVTLVLGYQCLGHLSPSGERIALYDQRAGLAVVDLAELWAANIEAQGWLEHGTLTRRHIEPVEDAA